MAASVAQIGIQREEREIGDLAVWSLSTAKPGNGVEQLRDDNIETYWHIQREPPPPTAFTAPRMRRSDGPQPHLINIQFPRKMRVHEIVIYTDFKLDESYTPAKISIRAGTTFHDLQEIHVQELSEPSGWVTILPPKPEKTGEGQDTQSTEVPADDPSASMLRTHFIQVAVLANHQNGRDTHIRQVKVFSPRWMIGQHMGLPEFNTVGFQQYACLR